MKLDRYEIYNVRLLTFMETEPQSNKYRQVILDAEQFKNMSFSLGKILSENGDDQEVELQLSEEEYDLPDLREHE